MNSVNRAKFNYDYSQCMVMKIGMSFPEKDMSGKSHVLLRFDEALDFVKKVDAMTPGITKIYYLVGWQYLGHDDKYPDFFEVNEALKAPGDATAKESFEKLYYEAKKYNSVISVHINFNDAYSNAPSFEEFVKKGALIRKRNGKIHAIERYNGRKCYKICHKTYWESGLFKKAFDRFLEVLPFIKDAGTVHVDNFQCYKNHAPFVSIKEMQAGRRKMVEYVLSKGIEITSEFTYKESSLLPNRPIFGLPRDHYRFSKLATTDIIPLSWWCYRLTKKELTEIPPQSYCGGEFREKRYNKLLYGNMHGEDIFIKNSPDWAKRFIFRFATYQVPFHFLNTKKRVLIKRGLSGLRCEYSDGTVSFARGEKITRNGKILKDGNTLFLPYVHINDCWLLFSQSGKEQDFYLGKTAYKSAKIFILDENGQKALNEISVNGEYLKFKPEKNTAYLFYFE